MTKTWVAILTLLAGCASGKPAGVATTAAQKAVSPDQVGVGWDRMRRELPGQWKARTASGAVVTETFRFVSNGSVLVETFMTPSGKETMSVYHRDRERLLLTHYCGQGNQPRLQAVTSTDAAVVFRFVDGTNILPGQPFLVTKELHLGSETLEQVEIYRQPDGTDEKTVLQFSREGN